MESAFWDELDSRAAQRGYPWHEYTRQLLAEIPPSDNRSSSIKEALVRMLREELNDEGRKNRSSFVSAVWRIQLPNQSQDFTIKTHDIRVFVGRSPSNHLLIKDHEVSRRHCMFVFDGQDWRVVDLDSKNGTWVKKKQVAASIIRPGDQVTVGASHIQLTST